MICFRAVVDEIFLYSKTFPFYYMMFQTIILQSIFYYSSYLALLSRQWSEAVTFAERLMVVNTELSRSVVYNRKKRFDEYRPKKITTDLGYNRELGISNSSIIIIR